MLLYKTDCCACTFCSNTYHRLLCVAPGLKGTFWLHTGNKLSLINPHLHGAVPSSFFLTDPYIPSITVSRGQVAAPAGGCGPSSLRLSSVPTSNISITWEHLGSLSWGPTPNLLSHNLFYKIPGWPVCMLKFEMHWATGNPLPSDWFKNPYVTQFRKMRCEGFVGSFSSFFQEKFPPECCVGCDT